MRFFYCCPIGKWFNIYSFFFSEKSNEESSKEKRDKKAKEVSSKSHKSSKKDKKVKETAPMPPAPGHKLPDMGGLMESSSGKHSTADLAAKMESFLDLPSAPPSCMAAGFPSAQQFSSTTTAPSHHLPIPPADMPTYNPPPPPVPGGQYPNYMQPMPPPPYGLQPYMPPPPPPPPSYMPGGYTSSSSSSSQPSSVTAATGPMRPTPMMPPYGMPPPPHQYGSWPHHSMWPHSSYDASYAAGTSYPGSASSAGTSAVQQFPSNEKSVYAAAPPTPHDPFSYPSQYGAASSVTSSAGAGSVPYGATPYATPYTGPAGTSMDGLSNDSFLDQLLGHGV